MAHVHDPSQSRDKRQQLPNHVSTRELTRMLLEQERESRDLEHLLSDMNAAIKRETARAAEAEQRARDIARRARSTAEARAQAQAAAARSTEEIALYKVQLAAAQQEIFRAQEYLDQETNQRQEAEERATNARSEARLLKEEKLVALAKEEGRRLGLAEGLRRGRMAGIQEGLDSAMREQSEEAAEESDGERTQRAESPQGGEPLILNVVEVQPPQTPTPPPPREPTPVRSPTVRPPTVRPPTVPPQPPHSDHEIHPIIVHGPAPSPRHRPIEVPLDGWIPHADASSRISLPPPHELEILPTSTRAPSRPLSADQPILMVPPPRHHATEPEAPPHRQHYRESTPSSTSSHGHARRHRNPVPAVPPPRQHYPESEPSSTSSRGHARRYHNPEPEVPPPRQHYPEPEPPSNSSHGHIRRHRRRRSSPESESTTFSQLEIISPPERDVRGRGSLISSRSGLQYERELSVIPEASPAYRRESLARSQAFDSPSAPQPMPYPTDPPPQEPRPVVPPMPQVPSVHPPAMPVIPQVYEPEEPVIPQQYSSYEWDDGGLRPPSVNRGYASSSGRSSTSSFVDISVIPPSRSPSNMSTRTEMPLGGLLTPDDANRPLPPIISSEPEAPFIPPVFPLMPPSESPSMFGPLSDSGGSQPIFLPSGNLPAGFVATSPISPVVPGGTPSFATFGALGPPSTSGWGASPAGVSYAHPEEDVYESPVIPPKMDELSETSSSSGAGRPSGYYANKPPPRRRSARAYDEDYDSPPVPVPAPVPTGVPYYPSPGGHTPVSRQSRSRYTADDSGSEISSSMGSNATLTTPPPRAPRSPLVPLAGAPLEPEPTPPPLPVPYGGGGYAQEWSEAGRTPRMQYAEAPLPADVVYPDAPPLPVPAPGPPRPRSAATTRSARTAHSSGSRAAGVALPPSTAGDSPRSAAGSLAGSTVASEYSTRGWAAHAGNTPGMRLGTIDEAGSVVSSVRDSVVGSTREWGTGAPSASGSRRTKGRPARSRYTATTMSGSDDD